MQNIVLWFLLALPLFLLPAGSQEDQRESARQRRFTRYVNCDFGYIVKIPSRLIARVPPDARHGFDIHLRDGESTIEIYNTYNLSDSSSPPRVFEYQLQARAEDRLGWIITSRHGEQINGLAAFRVTATYTFKGTQWKFHDLIAYRPMDRPGEGDIVYEFQLDSPLPRYERALKELKRVVDGFQLTQIPHGPCSND